LGLMTPVVLVGYLALHRASVEAGAAAVGAADDEWVLLGLLCAALTWLAATSCQLGAIDGSVPVGRLFATQVASSFVGHVLPAGVGQVGLNLRMLRRSGLSSEQALSAVALNAAAGAVVHIAALLVLLAMLGPPVHLVNATLLAVIIGAMIAVGVAAAIVLTRLRDRPGAFTGRVVASLAHLRGALRRPRRASLLFGGSIALPALHIATLMAVLHALGQPAPAAAVAVIYLASSAAGAFVPGPGGFGGFDVLLASALISSGLTAGLAAGTVIAYRGLTVWLPMVPSAATLVVLLRRKIV
jgi:uncharacterized membrane protein YbhN (UPF0104 family)